MVIVFILEVLCIRLSQTVFTSSKSCFVNRAFHGNFNVNF